MNQSDAPAIIDELCTIQCFALRCVRIFPGVNSRAELVTLTPGLRPVIINRAQYCSNPDCLYFNNNDMYSIFSYGRVSGLLM